MSRWKIWYADGTTFDSSQGQPTDAPKTGAVVCIVEDGRFNRRKLYLQDYYVYSPTLDLWLMQNDAAGVIMRAVREPYIVVVAGCYMREKDFEQILIAADNDEFIKAQPAEPPHPAWKV